MAEAEQTATWDEATQADGFVNLDVDKEKILVISNWKLVKVNKFGANQVEFVSDVLEEDGEPKEEIKFTTVSRRLKIKLKALLEGKQPTDKVKLSILRVGEQFATQYSVKEITE